MGEKKIDFKNKPNGDIINMPVLFRKEYLAPSKEPKILEMPILGLRIVFKMFNMISHKQFQISNPKQKQLWFDFEDEWRTKDDQSANFTFPISEVDNHRNYKRLSEALKYLAIYKMDWHISENRHGKPIRSLGGLIKDPKVSEGSINFSVPSYWLDKLMNLGVYNPINYTLPRIIKTTKQGLFYFWILEVYATKLRMTTVSKSSFESTYDYDYKDINALAQNVLLPMRKLFDAHCIMSFNYKVSSKKQNITIKPYLTASTENKFISKKTEHNVKINYRLNYWGKQYNLSPENLSVIKEVLKQDPSSFNLLLAAHKRYVSKMRKQKIKADSMKKDDFLTLFQENIKEVYNDSQMGKLFKDGYPRIID